MPGEKPRKDWTPPQDAESFAEQLAACGTSVTERRNFLQDIIDFNAEKDKENPKFFTNDAACSLLHCMDHVRARTRTAPSLSCLLHLLLLCCCVCCLGGWKGLEEKVEGSDNGSKKRLRENHNAPPRACAPRSSPPRCLTLARSSRNPQDASNKAWHHLNNVLTFVRSFPATFCLPARGDHDWATHRSAPLPSLSAPPAESTIEAQL
jgi:hypothetical protein